MPFLFLPISELEDHIGNSRNASNFLLESKECFDSIGPHCILTRSRGMDRPEYSPQVNHSPHRPKIDLCVVDVSADQHPSNFRLDHEIVFVHLSTTGRFGLQRSPHSIQ